MIHCPLIEHTLFFCAVFTRNNLIWHYGAIKAHKHVGGYGRSSHMINIVLILAPSTTFLPFSPHHLSTQSINFPK